MRKQNMVALILLVGFLIHKVMRHRWMALMVAVVLFGIFFLMCREVYTSILLAMLLAIGSDLAGSEVSMPGVSENFESGGGGASDMGKGVKAILGDDAAPAVTKENKDRKQNFKIGQKYENEHDDYGDDLYMDAGTTFMRAYDSLSEDQVSSMRKDTQDLIETQKKLMQTLEIMKPVMSQGKEMLDNFKNYFGSDMNAAAGAPTPAPSS